MDRLSLGGAQTGATHTPDQAGLRPVMGSPTLHPDSGPGPGKTCPQVSQVVLLLLPSALLGPLLVPSPLTCPGPLCYHGDSMCTGILGTNTSSVPDYLGDVRQVL